MGYNTLAKKFFSWDDAREWMDWQHNLYLGHEIIECGINYIEGIYRCRFVVYIESQGELEV